MYLARLQNLAFSGGGDTNSLWSLATISNDLLSLATAYTDLSLLRNSRMSFQREQETSDLSLLFSLFAIFYDRCLGFLFYFLVLRAGEETLGKEGGWGRQGEETEVVVAGRRCQDSFTWWWDCMGKMKLLIAAALTIYFLDVHCNLLKSQWRNGLLALTTRFLL